jgi:FAD/FMN-containing dehydrogenase
MKKLLWIIPLALVVFFIGYWHIQSESDDGWPSQGAWKSLSEKVQDRLIQVKSPLCTDCAFDSNCASLLKKLQNPFVIEEYPWATQSTGWLNAWTITASPYAVAVQNTNDIVAAVKFAKKHNLKLVIRGTGHDYLGRSTASQSLLVWTHHMRDVTVHDVFIPQGAPEMTKGVPAVTAQAGARWIEVYNEVTTKHGRYVQGGGCATVGAVGGFLQGGGFGSFSKKYGIAAGSLLEVEIVLASGDIIIANEYQNSDLFWALKGGGGGTFGIVSKATLQTHELPQFFGVYQGKITAKTDSAFENLIECFIDFYRENLSNEHWGEQISLQPNNTLNLALVFQGLTEQEVNNLWKPFLEGIRTQQGLYLASTRCLTIPANKFWDYDYLQAHFPEFIKPYKEGNKTYFYWANNQNEVLAYWYTMQSCWLPISLFSKQSSKVFAHTLFEASRSWEFSLHFNKGLAGASSEALKRSQDTPINPLVLDAAALAIFGANTQNVFPGMTNHEPNFKKATEEIQRVNAAMKILIDILPEVGTYSNESDYFQKNWQQAFWGEHYPRLLEIKQKYDPEGFFKCHHSVGSEKL